MWFCRKVFVISAKQATVLVVPTVVVILRCFLCDSWLDVLSFGFSTLVRRVHVFYRLSTGQSLLGRCLRCWRCSLPVGIIAISARHASFCSQVGSQSGQVLFLFVCLFVCSYCLFSFVLSDLFMLPAGTSAITSRTSTWRKVHGQPGNSFCPLLMRDVQGWFNVWT